MIRIRKSIVATLTTFAAVAVIGVSVAHGGPGTAFNAPVKVTPDLGFGYEPATVADGYGNMFYLGNEGDKVTYPLGQGTGSGFGPGRYTVYRSTDGGQTFDPLGYTLKDSGWCRPAADHAPASPYVYVVCGNDGGSNDVFTPNNPKGTLYAYVSSNDGVSFERYVIGSYNSTDSSVSWPTVSVAPHGP